MNLWDDCRYEDDRYEDDIFEDELLERQQEELRRYMYQAMWEGEEYLKYEASKEDEDLY